MQRLLFVDHQYHEKTRSADFFVALLRRNFEVEIAYVNPEKDLPKEILDKSSDKSFVVIWQMDYLAPVFISLGVPTIVIPMYDGSALMPDIHWIFAAQARYINFSFSLHHHIRLLGCESLLLKYFKPPVPEEERAKFNDGLHVFIWHRAPQHGINLHAVEKLLGQQIQSVHVHNVPDDPEVDGASYILPNRRDLKVTVSNWLEHRSDYARLLARANVFFAPRAAEGIGMAMLEAMARGMVVFASHAPTHNEYICNRLNGILFNPAKIKRVRLTDPEALGEMAWHTVVDGYATWEKASLGVAEFIRGTPKPQGGGIADIKGFAQALSKAYYSGLSSYRAYLILNTPVIAQMSGRPLANRVTPMADMLPATHLATARPADVIGIMSTPWLENNRLIPGRIEVHRTAGVLRMVDDVAWIIGLSATLAFHVDPTAFLFRSLSLVLHRPLLQESKTTVVISLNDILLGIIDLVEPLVRIELPIPDFALQADNQLRIQANQLGSRDGIEPPVSLGLEAIIFT